MLAGMRACREKPYPIVFNRQNNLRIYSEAPEAKIRASFAGFGPGSRVRSGSKGKAASNNTLAPSESHPRLISSRSFSSETKNEISLEFDPDTRSALLTDVGRAVSSGGSRKRQTSRLANRSMSSNRPAPLFSAPLDKNTEDRFFSVRPSQGSSKIHGLDRIRWPGRSRAIRSAKNFRVVRFPPRSRQSRDTSDVPPEPHASF